MKRSLVQMHVMLATEPNGKFTTLSHTLNDMFNSAHEMVP